MKLNKIIDVKVLSHVATKMFHLVAFGKTPRGPRCARQARQRLAMKVQLKSEN